jgi:hypothetical protein
LENATEGRSFGISGVLDIALAQDRVQMAGFAIDGVEHSSLVIRDQFCSSLYQ